MWRGFRVSRDDPALPRAPDERLAMHRTTSSIAAIPAPALMNGNLEVAFPGTPSQPAQAGRPASILRRRRVRRARSAA